MMDLGLSSSQASNLSSGNRAQSKVANSSDLAALLAKDNLIVTGIGARVTPADMLALMTRIGSAFEARKARFRSGGAGGADLAFEAGWRNPELCDIFHPWRGFVPKVGDVVIDVEKALGRKRPTHGKGAPIILSGAAEARAEQIAADHHPAWNRCSQGAKRLHTRNIPQILGETIDQPADIVICWTEDGRDSGGTGQALRLARALGIRVVNLRNANEREALLAALGL